jgi:hypothetical protein
MPKAFDEPDRQENRTQWKWAVGIAAIMLALIALMSNSPTASSWVSDAVQAEFASSNMTPQQAPVQTVQPGNPMRTVRAY